jgi:hypothetical protein
MAQEFFATLLRDGSSSNYTQRMLTFDEINGLLGLEELLVVGRSYDPSFVRDAAE